MVHALNKIMGVSYNQEFKDVLSSATLQARFRRDSRNLFLHGLLTGRKKGTCASMPVLVVALGRRLGYPLKLVKGYSHLFARWEDDKETFNIEATDMYAERKPDSFYRSWPRKNNFPLTSLTPSGELAIFLHARAMCLWSHKKLRSARVALSHANKLYGATLNYRLLLEELIADEHIQAMKKRSDPFANTRRTPK